MNGMLKIALTCDSHYGFSEKTPRVLDRFLKKLVKEEFDVLVHCGDWISHKQSQFEKVFKLFRKYIHPLKPILSVRGNHDFWNRDDSLRYRGIPKPTYESMDLSHKELMEKYGIIYLQDKSPYIDPSGVIFWGFDGWYNTLPPPSNDKYFMPQYAQSCPIDVYLEHRASKSLDAILLSVDQIKKDKPDCKTVCVTHHAPYTFDERYRGMCANPKYLDFITEKFDYFFVGHNHQEESWEKYGCYIHNSGSDYDNPKYKIIEV